jgi:hypothetical protein
MMDPVSVVLAGAVPAMVRVAGVLARSVQLRARADLIRAQAQRAAAEKGREGGR